ncbi:7-cyano-7-deazaguanine synthase [Microcoleus sp. FACHB-1515]|uniref:asparagine synthetase B family protein n=1 Tax=Cyanophyceae TaxID=3028117 RepID=UPI0016874763|nr:asparagine synthase-related protein [Microcoleus sp. FACHB-1515]MBD2093468.1 7-cyano-7-deazaguanine synthase [Microcoleus sp. FACHB-1515]
MHQKLLHPNWVVAWGSAARSPSATWATPGFAVIGVQPTFSPSQRFVLVGDCCFDRTILLQKQPDAAELSDLAIVAQLWEQWETETLNLIEGQFALAVWDQERQVLCLGRDRVGAKTLYYTTAGTTRWIAPRLRSLNSYHAHDLDPIALRDYLCCAFVPGAQTLWQGVRELRPGSYLRPLDAQPQRYWQPQEQIAHTDRSIDWHAGRVRSLLEERVQQALPVGESVGAFLSGGIDSSCVTAIAARLHDRPVHTFSIHFGDRYPSEIEFANWVAAHCRTSHHILEVSPRQIWQLLPETLAAMDDPVGEGLTVPNLLLARSAKQFVNLVLNGEGGDPCFAGPKNKPMLLNSLYGSAGEDAIAAYLTSFQKCFVDLPRLLKPEVWSAIKDQPFVFTPELEKRETTFLNKLMLLNIEFKGADYILTKVNNLTAAAELKARSPLFDPRMVELSLQIPPEYKLSGAQEKAVLKAAVADVLPDVIINRPKSGMVMSMQQWFLTHWQRQARSLLLNRNAAIAPYLNQSLIRDWLNYRGEVFPRYGLKLWLLVTLETWLQVNRR